MYGPEEGVRSHAAGVTVVVSLSKWVLGTELQYC